MNKRRCHLTPTEAVMGNTSMRLQFHRKIGSRGTDTR